MIIKIVMALVVVVVLILIVAAFQPSEFRIDRSVQITAPAQAIFPHVNDLHQMNVWSPWAKIDPAVKNTYAGPSAGVGSQFSWAGNNSVGEGRMTIIESHPSDLIRIKLEFYKPMAGTDTAEFTFVPTGSQTAVTWSMYGRRPFIHKVIGLFVNMDKMIGDTFSKGLAELKTISENTSRGK